MVVDVGDLQREQHGARALRPPHVRRHDGQRVAAARLAVQPGDGERGIERKKQNIVKQKEFKKNSFDFSVEERKN